MSALVKSPFVYEPTLHNDNYVDYLGKYTWKEFSDCGIKCPCSNSKTIHRNKTTFKNQHCKTKKHIEYLKRINEDSQEESRNVSDDFMKQMKLMKIQLGKEHEALQLQKQQNQNIMSQMKYLIEEKEEAVAESKQASSFAEEMAKKVIDFEKKIAQLEETQAKYDTLTREMMKIGGYEFE